MPILRFSPLCKLRAKVRLYDVLDLHFLWTGRPAGHTSWPCRSQGRAAWALDALRAWETDIDEAEREPLA